VSEAPPGLADGETRATKSQASLLFATCAPPTAPHPAFGHLLPARGEKGKQRYVWEIGLWEIGIGMIFLATFHHDVVEQ
jgi:hypothetical protein